MQDHNSVDLCAAGKRTPASISFTRGVLLLLAVIGITANTFAHDALADTHISQAVKLFQSGKYNQTITKCQTVLGYEQRADAYYLMALAHMKNRQFEEAIKALNSISARRPLLHPIPQDKVHYHLGKCYVNLGKTESAIQEFNVAHKLQPSTVSYLQDLMNAYNAAGKSAEAASIAVKLAKLHGDKGDSSRTAQR